MSLRKLLAETIDNLYGYTQDDLIDLLEENGISLEDRQLDYYIGSGSYGDVYKVKGKNKVIKFTDNEDEYRKINWIMDAQESVKPENVVKYHFNKRVDDGLYFSIMEYLEKVDLSMSESVKKSMKMLERNVYSVLQVSSEENDDTISMKIEDLIDHLLDNRDATKEDIEGMKDAFEDIVENYDNIDIQILLKWIWDMISVLRTNEIILLIYEIDLMSDYFNDVINGIKELKEMDVWHGDVHQANVLKDPRSNKYKLIDPI